MALEARELKNSEIDQGIIFVAVLCGCEGGDLDAFDCCCPQLFFFWWIASAGLPHFAHPSLSNGGAHTTSPLHPSDADRDCIGVDVDGLSGGHIRSPGRRVGE